jgi:uncharacterized LabA/DUF88 family protein
VEKATRRVGVFVDAENLPARTAARIFEVASFYGQIVDRRVYGDFAREMLRPWAEMVPHHALSLQTAQASISGKNSSDILLAVDATELLGKEDFDVFCIASTDSDFSHLASRIRMRGRKAIGLGGPKATEKFRVAFDAFYELEIQAAPAQPNSPNVVALKQTADVRPYIVQAFNSLGHKPHEWLDVSLLGHVIKKLYPTFSAKDFGHSKFGTVLKNATFLEVQMNGQTMQIRIKRQRETG